MNNNQDTTTEKKKPKKIEAIEQELLINLRPATPEDWRIWARGPMVLRSFFYSPEFIFELNEDKKVYVLGVKNSHSAHLDWVCDLPNSELIERIKA